MITYFQAIILGLIQGVTELFPISSLGHTVILPTLFGWNIDQNNNFFLIFIVATHLATALVLLGFFFNDWILILKGLGRSLREREIKNSDTYAKIGWLIIVSTIPAGILGILFEDKLKLLFASPKIAAFFLILNGGLLYCAELLRRKTSINNKSEKSSDQNVAKLSYASAIKIGFAQCLALIPGFSRTGSTLGAGLLVGLEHEGAARFSFLLATPIILAAAVLKLPELISNTTVIGPILTGAIAAAIAAYFSIRFLTNYFKKKTLLPFSYYCILAGLFALLIFFF